MHQACEVDVFSGLTCAVIACWALSVCWYEKRRGQSCQPCSVEYRQEMQRPWRFFPSFRPRPRSPRAWLPCPLSASTTCSTCVAVIVYIPVGVRRRVTAVVIVTSRGATGVALSTTSSSLTSTVVFTEVARSFVRFCVQGALVTVCCVFAPPRTLVMSGNRFTNFHGMAGCYKSYYVFGFLLSRGLSQSIAVLCDSYFSSEGALENACVFRAGATTSPTAPRSTQIR